MKSWLVLIPAVVLIAGILIISPVSGQTEETGSVVAFVGVNIVRPEINRVDQRQTVIVSGTRISRIGPVGKLKPPPGSRIVAAAGTYLMAGLAEMHAHVPHQAGGEEFLHDMLFLWAANGVTTIRGMNGEAAHLILRDRIARHEILGPRLFTAGPPFMGGKAKNQSAARQMVEDQVEAGFDLIKVHMGISREVYDAVAETATAEQIPFAGHVAEEVGLGHALAAGQASIDHLDGYFPALLRDDAKQGVDYGLLGLPLTPDIDERKFAEISRATREAGVWNAPTLSMAMKFVTPVDETDSRPGLQYMPPKMVKGWIGTARGFQSSSVDDPAVARDFLEYRKRLVKALHDAGAGLLLASDAPQILNVPGFSVHDELGLLIEAGLTPAEALMTGTVNPARFIGAKNTFGRVAQGLEADLVLTSENPLLQIDTLRHPLGVMLRGRWLSASDISAGLARIAGKYREAG
jgi:imidazolonepropionase-like amidohydrolase